MTTSREFIYPEGWGAPFDHNEVDVEPTQPVPESADPDAETGANPQQEILA